MTASRKTKQFKFLQSKKALSLPVTYLILFVSTMLLISFTYAFAVGQLNSQKQPFQLLTAKQDMTSLDDNVLSVMSQPGSANTLDFRDSGGQLNVEPSSNNLTLSITDGISINATIFNQTIGQVIYNLASAESANMGFYLVGDSNTITNQTGSSLSQLLITTSNMQPELQLLYRPAVSYATAGLQNGQAVNYIRIYIVNLNSSDPIALQGELPLKISCENVQLTTNNFQVSYQPENVVINSQLNGSNGSVSIPISSTTQGAIINIETVISNISIQRCIN